jgi:alanyl-tRNA synthetase
MRQGRLLAGASDLARTARDVSGVSYVGHHAPDGAGADDLRRLALEIRRGLPQDRPGVVAVSGVAAQRPIVVVAVNDRGREWSLRAGALVREAAQVLGGGGGGKDDVAQGGGVDATRVDEALSRIEQAIGETVRGAS